MKDLRIRGAATLAAALLFFNCIAPTLAQDATPQSSQTTVLTQSSGSASTVPPPSGSVDPSQMPQQGSISPAVAAALTDAITSSGTVVIDFGTLSNGKLDYGTNNFTNQGTIYAVSSNPAVTNATLMANNIYNQQGAVITTVLPAAGLPGYSNLVNGLNLTLTAIQNVVNAGTISSAGNLTVNAGASIINALPATSVASTLASVQPTMQAASNLNLVSSSIVNAGLLASISSNINVSSQTAQNILINNVGGTISALEGFVNVRDQAFVGKNHFALLGGDIFGKQLNIFSGTGIVDLQVNNLGPALHIESGDGYVSALSSIKVATLNFSGDPIIQSGSDVVFESDRNEDGSFNGHCTQGGVFNGVNAFISPNVEDINIFGAILNLTGTAELTRLPIHSNGAFAINADQGIRTGDIASGNAIVLNSREGNISTGNLFAGSNVVVTAPKGDISTGGIQAVAGVNLEAGQKVTALSITTLSGGFVDVQNNLMGGASGLTLGAGGNVGIIQVLGTSPTRQSFVYLADGGTGGITLTSPNNIFVNTPLTKTQIALDARAGGITLPSGILSIDESGSMPAGSIAMSAATSINADNTILSASSANGLGGLVFMGARIIDVRRGLTTKADGLFGGVGVSGSGAVNYQMGLTPSISPSFPAFMTYLNTQYNGAAQKSVTITGPGNFTASANGGGGRVFVDGGDIAFNNAGTTSISANGGSLFGNGGYVEVWGDQVTTQNTATRIFANGFESGVGGTVRLEADTGSLAIGPSARQFALQANGGVGDSAQNEFGGKGGEILAVAGTDASVNGAGVSVLPGFNGDGGIVRVFAGQSGLATSRLTVSGTLAANGNGSGSGDYVELNAPILSVSGSTVSSDGGPSGDGGTVVLNSRSSAQALTLGANTVVSASGGSTGSIGNGGNIGIFAAGDLDVETGAKVLSNSKGDIGNGGQNVQLIAGNNGANGNLSVAGTVSANSGSVSGNGGNIALVYRSITVPTVGPTIDGTVSANGKTQGGSIIIDNTNSAAPLNVVINGTVEANGGTDATIGRIALIQTGQPVSVRSAFGSGRVSGAVSAAGTNVLMELGAVDEILTVRAISASSGAVQLKTTGAGSKIQVGVTGGAPTGSIAASTDVVLSSVNEVIIKQPSIAANVISAGNSVTVTGTGQNSHIQIDPFTINVASIRAQGNVTLSAASMDLGVNPQSSANASGSNGSVNGSSITLNTTPASNGDIRLGTDFVTTTGGITLTAHNGGSIQSYGGVLRVGNQTSAVNLSTAYGNIGSVDSPVRVNTNFLYAFAASTPPTVSDS